MQGATLPGWRIPGDPLACALHSQLDLLGVPLAAFWPLKPLVDLLFCLECLALDKRDPVSEPGGIYPGRG